MCAGDVGVAGDGFVFFVVHGVAFRRLMVNDGLTVGAAECSAAMGLNLRRRCFRLLGDDDSGLFDPIEGDIPYSVILEKLSPIVTGISISVQVKEVKGVCTRNLL